MNRILKLDEFYSGAKSIRDSIEYFIDLGEARGIGLDTTRTAIELVLDLYRFGKIKKVARGSELHKALRNIEEAINTILEDGYPEEWIYLELEKTLNEI